MKFEIKTRLESFLCETISSDNPVLGGCISDSRIIKTESGNTYFLKTHSGKTGMFLKEANGLKELAKPNCIRVPKVILADSDFLLLENVEQGLKSSTFFVDFGAAFAKMHKYTASQFGFSEDNFIGASNQYNKAEGEARYNWTAFYYQYRIIPQLKMAEKNGQATKELVHAVGKLENKIEVILKGSEEPPTLLHGDLWSGNYLCDSLDKPVLIDPAIYYGHREADLAMTKMFGGFSQDFYSSYQKEYPLPDGWKYRENLYLLYHYFNHLNLFGSGYYKTTLNLLQSLLK